MKKRIIAVLLALILCIGMLPANVFAFTSNAVNAEAAAQQAAPVQNFSDWVVKDLTVGEPYGVYPLAWYQKDMMAPITQGDLQIIMYRIRGKMLLTDCVTKIVEEQYNLKKYSTVEEVLKAFYFIISSYEFNKELGLKSMEAMDFMKTNKIYTGSNGEKKLKDICSIEQACVYASRIVTCIYDKLDAGSKGFFWQTKSGGNTVYMLGSVHFASNDIYPFSEKIQEAFQSSDALALELNFYDSTGNAKINELGMYSDGTTLKDHVSAESYQKTVTMAANFGYTEEVINQIKPWLLYLMFSSLISANASKEEQQKSASLGIDLNFNTNALLTGKPVMEMEGFLYQGQVLDSFSDKLEEFLLNSTVDGVNKVLAGTYDSEQTFIDDALELWRKGDIETFKKFNSIDDELKDMIGEDAKEEVTLMEEFKEKFLTQRDKGMADYIDKLLKAEGSKTYFVVVGSAHYVSDHSVIDILKEKGYEITEIK